MFKEVFVVLCLMLAIAAAYPSEEVNSDQPVQVESDALSSEDQAESLEGAESRYGHGWYGGRGFGHYGGWGHGYFGRGFGGYGHRGYGHGWRYWG